ncbi:transcription initiation factor IID, 18kD subunit-domain-containing protein [Pseudomassariella vexata]|uniref:Transcription initiation factor TFIID subunit 13 n=1 Tax=Pseudomassariella vexata TaxID=1141098 RepID=A0A1Y2D767_9PEZI|nr:transcription initiation factor IID, 18kD subunit-domain-containing protein [Pseudomassariella vexata]ORY55113.1 transcription initiation factor IID, 18kD subunit-domain-containing protein [Pseudomassariella vexata]
MEPRARAGKNVGKETFPAKDISNLLYAYGDVPDPLPETVKVMDEILSEFVTGISFEACAHANTAKRQKLKFDDFEFALRRNPEYLGKVRTMVDKRIEISKMRKAFHHDDDAVIKDTRPNAAAAAAAAAGVSEDLLDDFEDDADVMDTVRNAGKHNKKKRKNAPA